MPEESVDTGGGEEPSVLVLFFSRVGSSQALGATLGDTLEGVPDETLATNLQQFSQLGDVLVGEKPLVWRA